MVGAWRAPMRHSRPDPERSPGTTALTPVTLQEVPRTAAGQVLATAMRLVLEHPTQRGPKRALQRELYTEFLHGESGRTAF